MEIDRGGKGKWVNWENEWGRLRMLQGGDRNSGLPET